MTSREPPFAVEAVCFDLDDTLFDFTQYVRAGLDAAADLLADRTGRALHEELRALYFEEGVRENTFDVLCERHDVSTEHVPDMVEAYHDHGAALEPFPEAEAVLAELSAEYRLGLVTDGRNGRVKLERLGLTEFFETVFVAHDHGISKRDPEAFRRPLADLGVDPADAAYVGDNPRTDFRESNRLGMATVRLRRGRYVDREHEEPERPDAEIDHLEELFDLLA